ncbi:uncharacterized protein LOC123314027 [Coccinella septempunctata]|uniref:uncharacterized protein LOC123314027 n=1 Tax=Coccinella septempunctata TaxID=41139 RepID=UPI001D06F43A|nr:uncharacterized protein LOC123314027 [Coccinella septempunctata]
MRECTTCIRYRGTFSYQKLGTLPSFRTKPSRPFSKSGVHYAGPYLIRSSKGRGKTALKGYIAVFICLCTKAVHLELVSGYSSADFIAAFRRFTSRRGHCTDLYSDQGTTFIGADKELKELYKKSSSFIKDITKKLSDESTQWHFNPPAAPHFGGIWEAAVKSTKHHLRRVVGSHTLTFEEFYTLLTQLEACLNSRPLLPLYEDLSDIQSLTPAHFLIQSASYIVPEPSLSDERIPPMQRWKQIQQMLQDWWRQWSQEYLQTLQTRYKWQTEQSVIQAGDLVLLTNENCPPAKWPLAKVIDTYPGSDKLVRVVKIRTATTELIRPITKLVLLCKDAC